MSILEQAEVFLDSDKSGCREVELEDGYLYFNNIHWGFVEPYVVLDGRAIILESDKNGSIRKNGEGMDIKGLLDRNGFTNPKAVFFKDIEGVLIYQDDEIMNNSQVKEGGNHND